MFFKKKKVNEFNFDKLELYLWGVKHNVNLVVESDENLTKEDIEKQCYSLINKVNDVEGKLSEYVENNYYNIIIQLYASVDQKTIRKKESSDYRLIMNDLKNKTMDAKDIILKNIIPIYFSIVDNTHSYLFVYLGYADEYGLDIIFNPEIIIHGHDGEI